MSMPAGPLNYSTYIKQRVKEQSYLAERIPLQITRNICTCCSLTSPHFVVLPQCPSHFCCESIKDTCCLLIGLCPHYGACPLHIFSLNGYLISSKNIKSDKLRIPWKVIPHHLLYND